MRVVWDDETAKNTYPTGARYGEQQRAAAPLLRLALFSRYLADDSEKRMRARLFKSTDAGRFSPFGGRQSCHVAVLVA